MPLLKHRTKGCLSDPDGSAHLSFWHITETEEALAACLPSSHDYLLEAHKISTNANRRKEWLAVRALLFHALGPGVQIAYSPLGSPYLSGSPLHVSISHSHGFAALALSPRPVGLDIEVWGPRALRLSPRFITAEEGELLSEDPERMAVMIWSAKEAIYKRFSQYGISLYDDIHLEKMADGRLLATIPKLQQHMRIVCEACSDFALTYTLD